MILKLVEPDLSIYPQELLPYLQNARLFDSSCSPQATVTFIEKDNGYFLKSADKGKLEREATMTKYFHNKNLGANVVSYISNECDWLLTEKITGDDCVSQKYLEKPERLCDIFAEQLVKLHSEDFSDCPISNHTEKYIASAKHNYSVGNFDKSLFPDNWGYKTPEEAYKIVEDNAHLLQTNTLLHGDYCLPNIILNDWKFSGFIDLDTAGVGDRHVDIFWAIWTLNFNLKTDKYRNRFMDAYGKENINEDILKVIAAIEVFG